MTSLAERLGMRRSPSGLDTTGALRLPPEPVRTVLPMPPHEPEPYPDEPFAPAYDYVPLDGARLGPAPGAWAHARTDPLVFGPPGTRELQGRGNSSAWSHCETCGVTWSGEVPCWNCPP